MRTGLGIRCHKERIVLSSKNPHRFLKTATLASPVKAVYSANKTLNSRHSAYVVFEANCSTERTASVDITNYCVFPFLTPPTPTFRVTALAARACHVID